MSNRLTGILLGITLLTVGLVSCQSLTNFNLQPNISPASSYQPNNYTLADPSSLTDLEDKIYKKINQYRLSHNLPPLKLDPKISQQARIHSEQMAARTIPFSDNGFAQRSKIIALSIPYQEIAENVTKNQEAKDPINVAFKDWIKNKINQKHIKGEFDLTGIGMAKNEAGEYYFTQIFIKTIPSPSTIESLPIPKTKPEELLDKSSSFDEAVVVTLEQEVHRQVNQYRLSRNLPALRLDKNIINIARLHSQNMAKKIAPFSHDGFEKRVKAIEKTIPLQKAGENLAKNKGYVDPATVSVQGWINSSEHRQNMEGDFNVTGIGIAKSPDGEYYFTQIFVLER